MHTNRSSVLTVRLVHGAHRVAPRQRPIHLDVAEHVLLLERAALEGQAQALAHHAVRAVGADQIARAHGRPVGQCGAHPVGVLVESRRRDAALHRDTQRGEFVAQDGFGLVLRDADEAERHIVGKRQRDLPGPHSVDVDELAVEVDGGVQDAPQHAHVLEHLERTGLHANGFRIQRRLGQRIDDPAAHAAAGQFDGSGQADRARPGDENVGSLFVLLHTGDYAARGMVRLRSMSNEAPDNQLHAGHLIARRLRASGIDTVFTLSGGHLFSIYDGCRAEGIRLIDTRHEQTAAFAAEGWSKVTRVPGVAALTAGPGVTNGMSAMAAAQQNQSPMLVLGGRAPAMRWGMGSLQEIDHVPFVAPLTRYAATAPTPEAVPAMIDDALRATVGAPSGVSFVDFPMDVVFGLGPDTEAPGALPTLPASDAADGHALARAVDLLTQAQRPVIMAGTGVWWGHAEAELLELAETLRIPVLMNGMARGWCRPITIWRSPGRAVRHCGTPTWQW